MSKKKKLPDFDKMSEDEIRHYVIREIIRDLTRGDRHSLTQICEMWSKEDIIKDHIAMEVDEKEGVVHTRLKMTSSKFILDLWDEQEKRHTKANYKSNKRYYGHHRKNDRQTRNATENVNKEINSKDKKLANN